MRLLRAVLAAFDLAALVNLLTGPGPVVDQLRALAVALLFLAAVVVLFVVVVLGVALLDQRRPPYLGPDPDSGWQ
jgi:hypothetical protein